jgi:hypothetical protein
MHAKGVREVLLRHLLCANQKHVATSFSGQSLPKRMSLDGEAALEIWPDLDY